MKHSSRPSVQKCLVLGILVGVALLFQNMSWVDIRDLAPEKPKGYLHDPLSDYVPNDMSGRSLDEVGRGLLSHNFDPWFQQFETKYLRAETEYFGVSFFRSEDIQNGEMASLESSDGDSESALGKWRMAIVTPQKMRLSLQKRWSGKDFEMTWEAQAGQEGVLWAMNRPLTEQLKVGFSLQTGLRQSQIQMDYSF